MAKRSKYTTPEFPGLFDDQERTPYTPHTVQPDIARPSTLLEGGLNAFPRPVAPSSPLGPVVARPVPNRIRFMSLGSGSSGNCCYIGDSQSGFLVDAGVDAPTVVDTLRRHGINMQHVKGICITHDHSDHMRCVYTLLRKHQHMALYCTPRALSGIMRRHSVSRRLKDYHVAIYKEIPFSIGNFTITAFETMHDGNDNAGFFIQHDDRAFTIATDLGCISPRVDHYMRQTDYLVIESNYDLEMLRHGSYPEYLKARIQTDNGHMDNLVTARYLAEIYTPRLKNVFLCHLSQENNTPEKALDESRKALEGIGLKVGEGNDTPADFAADIQLVALPRTGESRFYSFRPAQDR
ncbi:MBL fold metallo-hydrolase [Muribaculum sp.]|uniref:MBL fold metallo-hydrolase n=1 Tax=Muribaculum sp. TaxID=1918611 RepID=UPI0023C73E4C|nr:MBL fold metallo-hydrolase [Muribaculum sp.]MDE5705325.1 MBL fold metallo-hydrolase [Muribaculum sp.]